MSRCIKDDWLTDNSISFWEEYLEHEKLRDFPKANIVLLRPSMAFLLMNTKDPLSLKSALPDFQKTTHIFLPVNDCRSVDVAEGGSHWSLLLVSVIDGVAFHYDSMTPANIQEAKLVPTASVSCLASPSSSSTSKTRLSKRTARTAVSLSVYSCSICSCRAS